MQSDSNTRYDSPPDTVLVSNDGVHFDVHCSRFPEFSGNNFGGLLAPPPDRTNARSIQLPEDSQIINLILHIVYGVYFRPSSPSRQTLLATLRALHKYGIRPSFYVVPNSPIFDNLISSYANESLELYAIGAENDIFELARQASEHLLDINLQSLSNEVVMRIGSSYLTMLYTLHAARAQVLQRLLLRPPDGHTPDDNCGPAGIQRMKSDWAMTTSSFVFSLAPSPSHIS